MSGWFWVLWAVAGLVLEGIALFTSVRGDTLSEHLWVWLGIRKKERATLLMYRGDEWTDTNMPVPVKRGTPKWTVRVARIVFGGSIIWFLVHIFSGGQV